MIWTSDGCYYFNCGQQMDGYEATRQIRKWEMEVCEQCSEEIEALSIDERDRRPLASELKILKCPHRHLPIVAVTADVMTGTHELCVEAGMDDYISKVRNFSQLTRVVSDI
jgi:histidine kinase 2/3/4 (cytokinin receptor)